jgi:hypothetical protein
VTGLVRHRYDRHLTGLDFAVGIRFRPAYFRPFVRWPVSRLTNQHHPIAEVLGRSTAGLRERIEEEGDQVRRADILAAFLLEDVPAADEAALLLAEVVGHIAGDHSITRFSQVAALAQMSVRKPAARLRQLCRCWAEVGHPTQPVTRCRGPRRCCGVSGLEQSCRRTGIC